MLRVLPGRVLGGMVIGGTAAVFAGLGHVAGGGETSAVHMAALVVASALLFAAATELRAPLWSMAVLATLVQVAGHLLFAPLGGHSGAGGHAHGMPGQAARGPLDATVSHLADGGAVMIAMHALSLVALLAVIALAGPLAGLLVTLTQLLAPALVPVTSSVPVVGQCRCVDVSTLLRHVVSRRGPPAFV